MRASDSDATEIRIGHHSVYAVELDPRILEESRKFRDENPHHIAGMPCLYVGRTGLSPEERFENQMKGHKAASMVTKYGVRLRPELYEEYNPMTWEEVQIMEVLLAVTLRSQGYAVWQR